MSKDKNKDLPGKGAGPSGDQAYEFYYLEEKLGVSRAEVMAAIEVVGANRHQVEGYLRRQHDNTDTTT